MTHEEIAKGFNDFSFNFHKSVVSYINEETKNRVVISKLYYALLHYYFSLYPDVALSTGSNKHESILKRIKKERSQREFALFVTLQELRIWADYQTLNTMPREYKPAYLFHQVFSIIQSSR